MNVFAGGEFFCTQSSISIMHLDFKTIIKCEINNRVLNKRVQNWQWNSQIALETQTQTLIKAPWQGRTL